MDTRKQNIVSGIALLAISVFVYYQTYTRFVTSQAVGGGPFANSAFFPRVVAGVMAILALILLAKSLFRIGDDKAQTIEQGITPSTRQEYLEQEADIEKPSRLQVLSVAGLLLLYTLLLPLLGYIVATPLFMAALFYMLRLRRPFPLAILSLGSVAVIYFLFAELLNVIMPRGRIW